MAVPMISVRWCFAHCPEGSHASESVVGCFRLSWGGAAAPGAGVASQWAELPTNVCTN